MSERALHAVPDPEPADEPLMRELIGHQLRRARIEQGRTLREVAETAQVSLPYLSEIERGRKEPSSEMLVAVYRALGLRLVDLVGAVHTELGTETAVAPRTAAPTRPAPGSAPRAMLLAA
ncbi:transcriptional regulator with XRE-family HTH domain [Lipingzhangella halophila]|uniref:Transcriptional regulator with XRE-family HTH domain n=1 Tax=Lipingzhangella halophila TaxID=1783352 RepID=A0A7W7RN39_9ACTN|nr:helix-turn-helix transcriptional regulator [Lipingzhangella halophila]MBB4934643.1 transcriptional regulator with XRE-family HTH domain [Lipingzhangella halophila]